MREWKHRSRKSLRSVFCILLGDFLQEAATFQHRNVRNKKGLGCVFGNPLERTGYFCQLAGGGLVAGRLPRSWCKLRNRGRHDDTVCVFSGSTLVLRMELSSAAPSIITSVLVINPLCDSITMFSGAGALSHNDRSCGLQSHFWIEREKQTLPDNNRAS